MTPLNKQNNKNSKGINPTPDQQKERPGEDAEQPTNADYDYRPDFGTSGGAVEHNPELENETLQDPEQEPVKKPERGQ